MSGLSGHMVSRVLHQLCLDRQKQPLILVVASAESLSRSACRLAPASHVQRQRQPSEVTQIVDHVQDCCALCRYLAGSGHDTLMAGLVLHNYYVCSPRVSAW